MRRGGVSERSRKYEQDARHLEGCDALRLLCSAEERRRRDEDGDGLETSHQGGADGTEGREEGEEGGGVACVD